MKVFGPFIIVLAIGLMWFSQSKYKDLTMTPTNRLNTTWSRDFKNNILTKTSYKNIMKRVTKIERSTNDPEITHFMEALSPPFPLNPAGDLIMQVHLSRFFDGNSYGFIVQHDFINAATEDKIFEFGRTYDIGLIW